MGKSIAPLEASADLARRQTQITSSPESGAPIIVIQRSPKIPGGDRTVGPPPFPQVMELLRRGKFFATEGFCKTFEDPIIGRRPDIKPSKVEEQEHFNGPSANPAHHRQTCDNFFVTH